MPCTGSLSPYVFVYERSFSLANIILDVRACVLPLCGRLLLLAISFMYIWLMLFFAPVSRWLASPYEMHPRHCISTYSFARSFVRSFDAPALLHERHFIHYFCFSVDGFSPSAEALHSFTYWQPNVSSYYVCVCVCDSMENPFASYTRIERIFPLVDVFHRCQS